MRRETSRTGSALPLVILLLLVMTVAGFASHARSRQAGSLVLRTLDGDRAQLAADSAVEAMSARLRLASSRPFDDEFARLRQEVYAGQPGAFELPRIAKATGLDGSFESDGSRLLGSSAKVLSQRQLEDLPYEKSGVIRYTARVSAGRRGAVREVTAEQEFKTVLATVPRPFDQTSIWIGDAWSVTDFAAVNRLRARYLKMVESLVGMLDRALAASPARFADRYRELREFIPSAESLAERAAPLPESRPLALLVVGMDGQNIPLDALDLAAILPELEASTQPARDAAARAFAALGSTDEASHENFLEALSAALEATQQMLDRIWAYSQVFRFLAPSDPLWGAVTAEQTRLGVEHWQRVAGYRVRGASQLDELRARLGAPSGVVLVEADRQPIALRGDWKGKLVLVVRNGSVTLDELSTTGGSLLTVVCLGGSVTVQGRVEASLVLAGPEPGSDAGMATLTIAPGAELAGNLVTARLSKQGRLAGSVVCAEKFRAGATGDGPDANPSLDHYVVQLAPSIAVKARSRI